MGEQINIFFVFVALLAVTIAVFSSVSEVYQSRRQIRLARERGLWPPSGHVPTEADLKRLVKAGEKTLAIRMCRQLHNLGSYEAQAVVEKMAGQL